MKWVLVMLAAAASNASSGCALVFEDGWIPPAPPTAAMSAGYGTFRNTGDAELTVTGASSPLFGGVEMHETTLVGDTSRMRQLEAVAVPAKSEVTFAPGGKHLMLMRPSGTGAAASGVTVAFTVAGCESPLEATLRYRSDAGDAAEDHSHHHH